MTPKLLKDAELERSSIVANCWMNRERGLYGTNSYCKELRFDPIQFLKPLTGTRRNASWLDLCCGTGKALIEAAMVIESEGAPLSIVGVDLTDHFAPHESGSLVLSRAALTDWRPGNAFDLITCVHGLHYVGDKLRLITRAASWLTEQGRFVANLDAKNLRLLGRSTARPTVDALRRGGFTYSARHHLLACEGRREVALPFRYLGADDNAGPNYTRQEAVDSYYQQSP